MTLIKYLNFVSLLFLKRFYSVGVKPDQIYEFYKIYLFLFASII